MSILHVLAFSTGFLAVWVCYLSFRLWWARRAIRELRHNLAAVRIVRDMWKEEADWLRGKRDEDRADWWKRED